MSIRQIQPDQVFFDNNGVVLSGGFLNFYEIGTSTRKNTYSDNALTTANTNGIELNSAGRLDLDAWGSGDYTLIITNSSGGQPRSYDLIAGSFVDLSYSDAGNDIIAGAFVSLSSTETANFSAAGIYLGGTEEDNLINDRQVSKLFTAVISDAPDGGGNRAVIDTQSCSESWIGNTVTIHMFLFNINTVGMTAGNILYISGFTHAHSPAGVARAIGSCRLEQIKNIGNVTAIISNLSTNIVIFHGPPDDTFGSNTALLVSKLNNGSADIELTITYEKT